MFTSLDKKRSGLNAGSNGSVVELSDSQLAAPEVKPNDRRGFLEMLGGRTVLQAAPGDGGTTLTRMGSGGDSEKPSFGIRALEGTKGFFKGVGEVFKAVGKSGMELIRFIASMPERIARIPEHMRTFGNWVARVPLRIGGVFLRVPLTIAGGLIKGLGLLSLGLGNAIGYLRYWPASAIASLVVAGGLGVAGIAVGWAIVPMFLGGMAAGYLTPHIPRLLGKGVYAVGASLTYASKKIGDAARGYESYKSSTFERHIRTDWEDPDWMYDY